MRLMRNRKKRKVGDGRGRRLRVFAWILALVLALTGWVWFDRHPVGFALQLTAALVFAVGATWPRAFERLYRLVGPAPAQPFSSPPGGQASG